MFLGYILIYLLLDSCREGRGAGGGRGGGAEGGLDLRSEDEGLSTLFTLCISQ